MSLWFSNIKLQFISIWTNHSVLDIAISAIYWSNLCRILHKLYKCHLVTPRLLSHCPRSGCAPNGGLTNAGRWRRAAGDAPAVIHTCAGVLLPTHRRIVAHAAASPQGKSSGSGRVYIQKYQQTLLSYMLSRGRPAVDNLFSLMD